jgi:hypothetical protein
MATSQGLIYGAALVVNITNFILKLIVVRLAKFEKHSSLSQEQSSITSKLSVNMILNTSIIVVLVNTRFTNAPVKLNAGSLSFDDLQGKYTDFVAAWFVVVGMTIVNTLIFTVFEPLSTIVKYWVDGCRRRRIPKHPIQSEVNKKFVGPDLNIAIQYASIITVVVCCTMFAAGMPILWFILALACLSNYLFDKWGALRLYRAPARYGPELNALLLSVLPWALWIYTAVGIWTLSSPILTKQITTKNELIAYSASRSGYGADVNQFSNQYDSYVSFADRFSTSVSPTVVAFALLTAYHIIHIFFSVIPCCHFSADSLLHAKVKHFKTYHELKAEAHLENYQLSSLEEYADAYINTASQMQLHPPVPIHEDYDGKHTDPMDAQADHRAGKGRDTDHLLEEDREGHHRVDTFCPNQTCHAPVVFWDEGFPTAHTCEVCKTNFMM